MKNQESIFSNRMRDDQLRDELKAILLALYDGQTFQIGKLLAVFRQTLESKSIEIPGPQKLYNLFYSVKDDLEKNGLIMPIKQGIYYVSSEGVEDYSEDTLEEINEEGNNKEDCDASSDTQIIGSGAGEVYLYYYPSYRELANLKGVSTYRCKIGKTTIGCSKRFSTGRTEEPEYRKISLIIKTDRPAELEKFFHASLSLQGKRAVDAPGNEWFITNEAEVLDLYHNLISLPREEENVSLY